MNLISLILDDDCWSCGADEEGVECYITKEKIHYFDMIKAAPSGKEVWVCITIGDKIVKALDEQHWIDKGKAVVIAINDKVSVLATDNRSHFRYLQNDPEYTINEIDDETHWANVLPIEWVGVDDNECGITSIGYRYKSTHGFLQWELVGYNRIEKGSVVMYEGVPWTVVMVSRFGDFGLSKTGSLPYTVRVKPHKVELLAI